MPSRVNKKSLALGAFIAWLRLDKALSEKSIHSYRADLEQFFRFLEEKKIQMKEVQEKTLIFFLDKLRENGISDSSIKRKISSLRSFYRFQESQGEDHNPSTFIQNPKKGRKLPLYLSEENILALFRVLPCKSPTEKQEYLIFLLLYSCGLRISELLSLKLSQVNQKTQTLRIKGKGGKERLVPYPKEIQNHMHNYIKNIWPQFNVGLEEKLLFVRKTKSGVKAISRQQFWYRLKQLAKIAAMKQNLSPHMLRHSFASQLLKSGMNLRVLQKLLGHSSISTTEIYTHIEEERLRQGHKKFHPRK